MLFAVVSQFLLISYLSRSSFSPIHYFTLIHCASHPSTSLFKVLNLLENCMFPTKNDSMIIRCFRYKKRIYLALVLPWS